MKWYKCSEVQPALCRIVPVWFPGDKLVLMYRGLSGNWRETTDEEISWHVDEMERAMWFDLELPLKDK